MNKVKIHRLYPDVDLPDCSSAGHMGLRLYGRSPEGHKVKTVIPPHTPRLIRTGISLDIPSDHVAFLLSRRDDAKKGLIVVNAPITLQYDNEIKVVLMNSSMESCILLHGDLVANLVFLGATKVIFEVV